MSTNGINSTEDADMAELAADDGEKVVTMMDVLQEQQDFDDDANAVLGASDDKDCTYSKGYIKRQALYACLTCCTEAKTDPLKRAGVCLACSLNCHENHELVELYTKRNFRCDCGNPKFSTHPCQYTTNKTEVNEDNNYNQNFSGLYCTCHRPYPDPEATEEDEMIQCIICEDWLHASHLEATVPAQDQYSEMICKGCMEKNVFLHDYSNFAVNLETTEVDIVTVNGLETNETEKICNGDSDENKIRNDKTVEDVTDTSSEKETKIVNDIEMTEEQSKEKIMSQSLDENEVTSHPDISKEEKEQESEVVTMEADHTEEPKPEMENEVTESGDVVTSTEEKEKVDSAEDSINVSKEAEETINTATETTKTAEEIAELEIEKALLEEDEPSENSEKDKEPVIKEREIDEKESVIIEKATVSETTENIINTDNQTSEITSQNNESEKVDDEVLDDSKTEKCSLDNVTIEPRTEDKMDEDVCEDQTKPTPSEEQTNDVAATSIEITNDNDKDTIKVDQLCQESSMDPEKVDQPCQESSMDPENIDEPCQESNMDPEKVDQPCQESSMDTEKVDQPCHESSMDPEKQVTEEETNIAEESLVTSKDDAKEIPEKTDEISKSTDDNEIDKIESISTSVTSPKPDEQSCDKLITNNEDSPIESEDKPSVESKSNKEQITVDTVKNQNELIESSNTDTENKTDMETIEASTNSNEDETNVDTAKESIDESPMKTDEGDATKAEPDDKPAEEETNNSKKDESPVITETKSTDIEMDVATTGPVTTDIVNKDIVEQSETNQVKELDNQAASTTENKRKLSTEEIADNISVKKAKLEGLSKCIRPSGVKKVHKGATFWPSNFRQKLCTCNECLSMYKDLSVLFLIDPEDTVSAYEMLGQERINGGPTTQYERGLEALSSLDRIQQINALTEYNKMRDKLLDFLKSFKDRKEIVKEEDIKAFFAGMKPKREPDGVYFCR